MHKHIILFFSVLLFLTACGDDTPGGIIPRPEMTSLLTDIHLADGSLYNIPQIPDSLYKYGSAKYAAVFQRHHVTGKQFTESFKYYSTRPQQLTEMYTQIEAIIKGKSDSLTKSSTSKNNVIPHQ